MKCDDTVVNILNSGRARHPLLEALSRKKWYRVAKSDIDIQHVHLLGKNNRVANLLFKWTGSVNDVAELNALVQDPIWLQTTLQSLEIDLTM